MRVQSILFPMSEWSISATRQWLRNHNYFPTKQAHYSRNFIRYRLYEPKASYTYRTIILPNGVRLILTI